LAFVINPDRLSGKITMRLKYLLPDDKDKEISLKKYYLGEWERSRFIGE
jgi:hypothetical protein